MTSSTHIYKTDRSDQTDREKERKKENRQKENKGTYNLVKIPDVTLKQWHQ